MSWERTGTISIENAATIVQGVGTLFIERCRVGDALRGPDGELYEIVNVQSQTALEISRAYMGSSVVAATYDIIPVQGYSKEAADQLRALSFTIDPDFTEVYLRLNEKVDKVAGQRLSSNDFTNAAKDKLTGIATEATKNAADSFLLNRANHTGGINASDVAGLSDILSTKANSTHTQAMSSVIGLEAALLAKAGISHIHDIASVSGLPAILEQKVSTTDPRLSDAREWTAGLVSQSDAEVGLSPLRKAWSALRVRQAISAWWAALSSAVPAANKAVVSTPTGKIDVNWLTTVGTGKVLREGAGGILGSAPLLLGHLDDQSIGSLSYFSGTEAACVAVGFPALDTADERLWNVSTYGTALGITQVVYETRGLGTTKGRSFSRVKADNSWSSWKESAASSTQSMLDIGLTASSARQALELGTSALRDVGTNPSELLEVGAFGLGAKGNPLHAFTSMQYSDLMQGNTLHINSTGLYSSQLILRQNSAFFHSKGDSEWMAEAYHSQNLLNIGVTPDSARQALSLRPAALRDVGTVPGNLLEVGAFGLGDKFVAGVTDPTGFKFSPQTLANVLTINSTGNFASKLSLHVDGATIESVDDITDPWTAEVLHTKNQLSLGVTAESARAALELGPLTSAQFGTEAGTVVEGNDPRLYNNLTLDILETRLGLKVDKEIGKGLSTNDFGDSEQEKLDGVEPFATQNSPDELLRDRSTHTGTQGIETIDGLGSAAAASIGEAAGEVMPVGAFGLGSQVFGDFPPTSLVYNEYLGGNSLLINNSEEYGSLLVLGRDQAFFASNDMENVFSAELFHDKNQLALGISQATAHLALGLGTAATKDVGSVAGTVMAGDDPRVVGAASLTSVTAELAGKVDKEVGKGLSTNDFTTAEKAKLAAMSPAPFRGVFLTLPLLQAGVTSPRAGDYADVDAGVGDEVRRYIYDVSDDLWVIQESATSLTAAQVKQLYELNPDTEAFSTSLKDKLTGVASQATKNDTDANLKSRANHTGTQAVSTITGLGGAATLNVGTAAGTVMAGNDSRVIAAATSANLAAGLSLKVDKEAGKGLSTNDFSTAEKDKLTAIAAGATKNATDANLKSRANHTGTQAVSTITGLGGAATLNVGTTAGTVMAGDDSRVIAAATSANLTAGLALKVDKEAGKGLSTNDFSTAEKNKLAAVAAQATKNDTDANLKSRANHTGTQAVSTITGLGGAATRNVGLDAGDLVEVGAFGLGATSPGSTAPTGFWYSEFLGGNGLSLNVAGPYLSMLVMSETTITFASLRDEVTTANEIFHTGNQLTLGTTAVTARAALELGGAATLNVGTAAGTVMAGNDSRVIAAATSANLTAGLALKVDKEAGKGLSTNDFSTAEKNKLTAVAAQATKNDTDANLKSRANHTGTQAVSTITGLGGAATLNVGTAAGTVMAGNDSRVIAAATSANLTAGLALKVDKEAGKGLSTNDFSTAEKNKLTAVAAQATKNDTDANLKSRANHTGTQAVSTITGLGGAATLNVGTTAGTVMAGNDSRVIAAATSANLTAGLALKVDKEAGKGLSTNDFSTAEKDKLTAVAAQATKNDTDANLKSRANHTGTQPQDSVVGLVAALVQKVETTDPRMTDEREWTASTITLADAQAGTSEVRKAWTSKLVRAATTHWWNGVSASVPTADRAVVAGSTGKINTEWLQTVGRFAQAPSQNVLVEGAYGLGDMGENLGVATSALYNSFFGGNTLVINSQDAPFASGVILAAESASIFSRQGEAFWSAEVFHDKNQLALGTTAVTARAALGLGGAATLNVGTAAGTVMAGNDSRVIAAATSANLTAGLALKVDKEAGKGLSTNDFSTAEKNKLTAIATGATKNATDANLKSRANHTGTQAVSTITGLGGAATLNVGTAAGTVMAGDDSRVIAAATSANLTAGLALKVDKEAGKGLSTNDFSTAEKNKLTAIATGATKNATDATLLSRSNHTGTQASSTITGLDSALAGKVNTEVGKGLSTNDFSTAEKNKLTAVAAQATKNDTDANLKSRANHTGTQAVSTITGLGGAATRNVGLDAGDLVEVGAFGLGASAPGNTAPTGFWYTEFLGGNGITLNVSGPYLSMLSMSETTITFASLRDEVTTANEIFHTGNQLTLGTTAVTARAALELGGAATLNVGTAAGTVMAGNDPRVIAAATSANLTAGLALKVDKEAGKGLSTNDFSTAEKNKLTAVAAQATKNDTDANLKSRANHTGTQEASTITGLGGAATLNVGTAAGTVAAGNDARLTNSREWIGVTATQAQAEAGTETVRRAWTAQRIRQAIVGWWGSVSSVLSAANKTPIADSTGKLDISWLDTVGSYNAATTSTKLMKQGAFGLGEMGENAGLATSIEYNGLWEGNSVTINSPGATHASLLVLKSDHVVLGSFTDSGLSHASTLHSTSNQLSLGVTALTARAALELPEEGEGWIDLTPYLQAPFFWSTAREGNNHPPRARKLPCGKVELDGVVSFNETSGPTPASIMFRLPVSLRPNMTSAGTLFVDTEAPLTFGAATFIVSGAVSYSSGLHGEVMFIPVTTPPTTTGGAVCLNGASFFTD